MNNLTQAAYAAHRKAQGLRGTSSRAVRRALAAGRIHSERGGGIDPERADLEWGATTRLRIDSTKAQRALMHPCHAASWDLTTLLLRIEKCINAILKETVKG